MNLSYFPSTLHVRINIANFIFDTLFDRVD